MVLKSHPLQFDLISTDAGHVFKIPRSSIFTLGLIAYATFLSPSHAQESISLYSQYKKILIGALGIDECRDSESENRSLTGMKQFYVDLLKKLSLAEDANRDDYIREALGCRCLKCSLYF